METIERPQKNAWYLEGTYTEKDLRAFAAFLAGRVAGTKIWALGVFILMPLLWGGNIRHNWPLMVPMAVILVGFIFMLRYVILPNKLYKATIKLPGVFLPRRITVDEREVSSTSEAGGYTIGVEQIKEVITVQDYLYLMVTPKQGMPIPKEWIGGEDRVRDLTQLLLSRCASGSRP